MAPSALACGRFEAQIAYLRLEVAAVSAAPRRAVDEVLRVRRVRHVALFSIGDRGGGETEEEGGGNSEGEAHRD